MNQYTYESAKYRYGELFAQYQKPDNIPTMLEFYTAKKSEFYKEISDRFGIPLAEIEKYENSKNDQYTYFSNGMPDRSAFQFSGVAWIPFLRHGVRMYANDKSINIVCGMANFVISLYYEVEDEKKHVYYFNNLS